MNPLDGHSQLGLIGATGYVGTTLLRQASFASRFRSTNMNEVGRERVDTMVCAAAPAQKWIANREPEADRTNIETLIGNLESVECRTFVLISTIDVFARADGVDEASPVQEDGLHAYGLHRRLLEKFVASRFERHLIVRLPGLVGPGLRKNVIYDFLNDNALHAIDSRGVFQFYPMVNLWRDIECALSLDLELVHLTAEPLSVADVSLKGFGKPFTNTLANHAASYDMQTRHAEAFGGRGRYQYSRRESVQAIRAYAQSEPRAVKVAGAKP